MTIVRFVRACLVGAALALAPTQAFAQSLVATVNGDPVTTSDIDERMRLLRALRKPASREAALEDLVADSLKSKELKKFGVVAGDGDIANEVTRVAQALKLAPQAFAAGLQRAGVSEAHLRNHFAATAGFAYYVRARNRTIEPSDAEIRAEMAAQGKTAKSVDYRLQEILFVLPATASVALANQRGAAAQKFRSSFTDCETGAEKARALPEVAVKAQIARNSSVMNEGLRKLIDGTPLGHLSPPQRERDGIVMIAVCDKKESEDIANVREALSATILARKLKGESDRLYGELRSRAVIVKR